MLFVGQGKTFQIWEPTMFEKFRVTAKKNQIFIEQALNGKNNLITNRRGKCQLTLNHQI